MAAPVATPPPETPPADTTLTNDSIIEMVEGKVPAPVILGEIRASKTNFVLTSAELIRLSKAGVSGTLIEAMRDPKHAGLGIPERGQNRKPTVVASAKPIPTPIPTPTPPPPVQQTQVAKAAPPPPTPAPVKAAVPVLVPLNLTDGMPLSIRLTEDVPADAEEGHAVHFAAVDGLKVGGIPVIAKGAQVTGAVLEAAGKKIFGMGGKMTFQLLTVTAVDGKKLNIRAEPSRGKDGPAKRPFESGAKGRTKEIAAGAGSQYVAYIEGDQTVSVRK